MRQNFGKTIFKNQFEINEKLSAINIIEFHSKMTDVKVLVIRKT